MFIETYRNISPHLQSSSAFAALSRLHQIIQRMLILDTVNFSKYKMQPSNDGFIY